jgi:hypothetical protein
MKIKVELHPTMLIHIDPTKVLTEEIIPTYEIARKVPPPPGKEGFKANLKDIDNLKERISNILFKNGEWISNLTLGEIQTSLGNNIHMSEILEALNELKFERNFMDFPELEYNNLKGRLLSGKPIYTTRIKEELDKYKLNEIYTTSFGISVKVIDIERIENIEKHPFYKDLTNEQKKALGSNSMDLVKLIRNDKATIKIRFAIRPIKLDVDENQ